MSTNRFASLYLDDEDEVPSCEQLPSLPTTLSIQKEDEKPAFVATQSRTWSKDDASPDTVRDWNLEPTRKFRQSFSRGYSFHDDGVSKFVPLKSYAFEDESSTKDSVRPNTPVNEKKPQMIVCRGCEGEHWTQGCATKNKGRKHSPLNPSPKAADSPKVNVQSQEEFPTLSDYQRPQTPPYPPDDGDYPTLAERMRRSIAKEAEAKATFKPIEPMETFEMISVIPMRTNLNGNFTLS